MENRKNRTTPGFIAQNIATRKLSNPLFDHHQNIPARRRSRNIFSHVHRFWVGFCVGSPSKWSHYQNLALEQGKTPQMPRWFSPWCVDSQANFASVSASLNACIFDLAFALVCIAFALMISFRSNQSGTYTTHLSGICDTLVATGLFFSPPIL